MCLFTVPADLYGVPHVHSSSPGHPVARAFASAGVKDQRVRVQLPGDLPEVPRLHGQEQPAVPLWLGPSPAPLPSRADVSG